MASTSLWSTRVPPYSRRRRWWEARGSESRAPDWGTVQEEAVEAEEERQQAEEEEQEQEEGGRE